MIKSFKIFCKIIINKILNLLFKNIFMQYSSYRMFMNKLYRLFIYNPFLEPKQEYLFEHKKNKYLNEVKARSKTETLKNIQIIKFHNNLDNNFNGFFSINIKKMSSVNGSRFNSSGDPLCNTAMQIIKNKDIELEDLFLHKYFKKFNPNNLSEVFLIEEKSKLDTISQFNRFYPWHTPYPPPDKQDFFFGPKIKLLDEIKLRIYRLKNIYSLISKYGYIPSDQDCIDGYILKKDNDYRFIVTSGHHRASVLNAMNILGNFPDEVTVKFDQSRISNRYFIVSKTEVSHWPSVKNNFLSEKDAILHFDSYFKDKNYFN